MDIRPFAAHEPPYHAVVFTSVRRQEGGAEGYGGAALRMDELVRDVPGFLGYESARTPGGLGITVGYFRDEEAIRAWQRNAEHRSAQQRGRDDWYDSYTVHVAKVERSYGFERG
ncbi:antibiotic biosynthesis monooxygenase family protein [Streptomyces chryseus]|uniref:Antibiotic biosynthesis monooxygenase n=2 Tax=Streptomyces chryseus TaxID=68186 RepID=A0ABQ3E9S8_9ACTN|nr:antibiotic biosynthesis monooxygenase [Streptomyces chryseus]GHB25571.1 antibiotic biosynthesis monooxygenase [Streptomyces chryseus]